MLYICMNIRSVQSEPGTNRTVNVLIALKAQSLSSLLALISGVKYFNFEGG